MAHHVWIYALVVALSFGAYECSTKGKAKYLYKYITVFMFNSVEKNPSKNQLYITSYLPDTKVLVTVNNSPFKKELSMEGRKSVTVEVPSDTELRGSGKYSKTVTVLSSKFITILSSNQKKNSVDTSLVYPVREWGKVYYVFTPSAAGYPKEMAIFSTHDGTTVTVELKCAVTFEGKSYKPGQKLSATVCSSEVIYLQSDQDCTGSRVVSDKPVGVMSGHACAWKNSKCQHVFEQLLPVEHWGSSFIVLPLEYQVLTDSVYVFASQQTTVTYQFGAKSQTANLRAGQWKEIPMGRSPPLVISSSQPIQVLYYCNGGKFSDGSVFDPFIMNIVPTSQFGEAYTLEGLDGFSNYALIVAKTKDVKEVQFDGKSPAFKWEQVHGTDYSWAHYTYEKGRGHHTLMSPCAPIGVYSVGTVDQNSYGAPAASGLLPCIHKGNFHPLGSSFWEDSACTKLCQCDPSTGIVSCQASQCKAGEECKVVGDVRQCVGKGIKEPEGKPKVRTCTYKGQQHLPGKPFWDDSACTKLCDCNPSTGAVSCHDSACKSGEECKLVDNVRTCVAKAPVHKTKYLYRYITVFMFNSVEKNPSKNQLYITSYLPDTKVLVTVNKSPFKKELSMEGRKSVTVEVPSDTELRGSGKFSKTVTVLSSKFITILSSNQKKNSVDTSLVYPVREWGKVYYVFTPSAAGYPKEMAIFSTHDGTTVTVELKCAVTFEGKSYKPGQKLSATVCSSEVIYLQSDQDCTGSRVVSDKPVGVMSGHACAWKNSKCQHVFEQLLPVEHWGSSFIVLPLEYQVLTDSVYVFASQQTTVTYQFGAKSQTANLRAGQWKEIPMGRSPPLVISSSQPIQVLYYCNGGKFSDGSVFDPFIMNIVPTSQFGEAYTLEGLDGFSNYALIVAKTKDVKEVQFDGKSPAFKWEQVHGTDYSWAHYTYEKGRGHHTLMSPCAPIGVYSVGTVDQNSYGAPAASGLLPCIHKGNYHPLGSSFWEDSACTKLCQCDPSTGIVSCQASQCKAGEECKVVGDVRQCVGKGIKEPEGKPKVRTCTYKGQQHLPGKPFWDDSACTKLCDCNPSTGVVSCHDSACKSGEECKLVDNVRTCVAKAPVHKTKYLYRYITVFMFNSVEKNPSKNQLYITSYLPDTKVLVTVNKSPFKKELSMEGRKSVTVEVPSDTELRGSGKYSKTVTVLSSKFITILSSNQKKNSVDTSLVYPVREWGKVYYVFTPSAAGYPKEMAIFSTHDGTTVTVELKCAVTFEGKSYKPGQKLSATVYSSEVIYLQSDQDCTGSRVVSDKPVGVMSGHACAWKNSKCQHVFEQLLPVEHWGSSFIVLPLEYQVLTDSVYVFASQQTTVTYQFGAKSQTANLRAGQWKEIPMSRSPPLVISSSQPIQVLYYCNGGKFSDGSVFDPFIMNIVPTSQFGEAYTLEGLDGFSNYALIIAKTKDVKEVQFDGKSPAFKWEQVHGTDYSWAHYTYEKGRGHHTLMSPCAPIGVYSVGTVDQNSYGAPAASGLLPCIHKGNYHPLGSSFWEDSACTKLCQCDPSTGIVSCQASQCKTGEECKVVGDVRQCVGKGIKEPEGKPKVRTCTYKGQQHLPGKPFWDDSACTKLCDCNPSTGVVSCHDSACKSGEECKLVDNVRTCVAKAPVHKTKYLYRYITVFMFNSVEKNPSKNQLYITSYLPDTKVLVTVNKSPFKKELSMEGRKSVTVEVPSDTELRGSGKFSKTVTVLSSKFITILSSNQKKNSVDTSLVYPVREWGKVYYVFTPSAAGYPKEMAIFSTHDGTTVTVELKCAVTFEGKSYKPGQKLSATVCSSEVIYLQSDQDCTGSRVVSDKPVGVMSGHACAWKNSKCQHVFEQLLPVEHWGSSFIVLPLEYQVLTDSVYVFASQQTTVTYQFGAKSQTANLRAGQWKEIPMGRSPPLVISSSQPIQVLYYCNGGKFSDGSVFDPFIMNIVPTSQFGEAYTLEGLDGFSNYALIVAKTKDVKEVQFDGKSPAFKWEQVHGTDYSWAHYTYEKGRGHHTLMSPCAPIGVYSVGTVDQNSYGAPAASGLLPCIHKGNYHPLGSSFWEDSACTKLCQCDPSTGIVSCQASQCKTGEECKVVGDVRQCVGKGIKEPEGKPKVRTCTYKGQQHLPGKPFWDDSACTKLCDCNPSTGVVSCHDSACKSGEECKLVDNVRTCVAKAPVHKTKYLYRYITVFMFNSVEKNPSKNQLYITSYLPDTKVLVTVNKSPFKKELSMEGRKSVTVEVPSDTELRGSGKFSKTVTVLSSKFITILSSNQKKNSVDTSLVYPVREWGKVYYVFTPSAAGYPKEMAIFSTHDGTTVTVELKCAVTFEGKSYKPGQKLSATVCSSEVIYLQSDQDCTGSRVVSDKPVGVMSGHACAWKNSKCQHVFEQLLPVEHWGSSFIVLPLEYQVLTDSVYVFASQQTTVTYQFGAKSQTANLRAGQWKEIPMGRSPPLVISSSQPIQVLYYCNGGKFSDGSVFDPFIMNIVPTSQFGEAYTLEGLDGFSNYALIVAKTKDVKEVQFDGKSPAFKWEQVHGTDYSWAHYTYEKGRGHHTLMSPCAPIGVYSVGTVDQNSYGAPAASGLLPCIHKGNYHPLGSSFWEDSACTKLCQCDPSTGIVSCQASQCKTGEECKVVGDVRQCVGKGIKEPEGKPKVRTCTYKGQQHLPGKPFWDDSACTKLCDCNPSTGVVSCHDSACKSGEECKLVDNVRTCVAKAPVHKTKYLYRYITVFMFNSVEKNPSKNQLYITSYLPDTKVLVTVNKSPFKKELSMEGRKSVTVEVPSDTELRGSGKFSKTVTVLSSKFITILSSNQKKNSVDTSLVYPVREWGKVYYVFTPSAAGYPKEMAIFSTHDGTTVTVELKCAVTFEGKSYKPGQKLSATVCSSEVIYLQSDQDCTGSRVVSDKPVGVMSGHACAWKNSKCQHVFEQLLPVEHWGSSFIVLPLEYQVLTDSVYVFASQQTTVTYQFGAKSQTANLRAGQWKEIPMGRSPPLVISSSQPIQVLYYCNGGKFSDGSVFDPFIMNIVPTSQFGEAYTLEGLDGFSNYALIVAKTKDVKEVQFDGKSPAFKWEQVHGTDYSWAHYTYEKGRGHHTLMSPCAPIGVYSVGTVDQNSYGAPAASGLLPCIHKGNYHPLGSSFWEDSACTKLCQCDPSTGIVSCQASQCKTGEECKVVGDVRQCVGKGIKEPEGKPKVRTCTYKGQQHLPGKPFWDDSACTKLCDCNPSTGVVSCHDSACKSGEECKLVDNVRTCVAKAPVHKTKYLYRYITVFMFNSVEKNPSKNQLYITSYLPDTKVLVTVNKSPFKKELSMEGRKSVTVEVPSDTELRGSGKFSKTVTVLSSKFITILSSNQKKNSVDTSLVYPVREWGKVYYVFTPSAAGYPKEMAIFSTHDGTTVTVELKCAVTFEGKSYKPGQKLSATVCSSEVIYLQSDQDCTGSRVVSDKPVGVMSGHACAWKNSKCQHVFEQLLPVEHWGSSFIVLPLEYQVLTDSVYVFASQQTTVTYQFGAKSQTANLRAGQWKEIPMSRSPPLVISSSQPIQVLYYCNGGKFSDGSVFDPFIMNIVPTSQFGEAYTLEGLDGFSNYALIIAKTKDVKEVQFDGKSPAFKWEQVHGTDYSWAHYTYEKGRGHHTLMSPCAPIGVYSVGTVDQNSYGAPAASGLLPCIHKGNYHPLGSSFWEDSACTKLCQCDPSTGIVSCQASQCKAGEECKVVGDVRQCVGKGIKEPEGKPKVRTCTYKGQQHLPGKPFWDDSACTKLCDCNPSTGVVSCHDSACKSGEECKLVDNVRTCVAKAPVHKTKYLYRYITVFMFNSVEKNPSKNQLYITSYLPDTKVLVTVNKSPFKKELSMEGRKSVTVEVPSDTELRGSGKYSKTVTVLSSKFITILSSNQKKNSVDTSLVYPVREWGKVYYVFTPSAAGYPKEMAIFSTHDGTTVTVELKCAVTFEGKSYKPGQKLSATVCSSEVIYLQSDQDCTGSRVVSDKPVGVMSGHACAWKNSKCQHVFEQLLPVEHWGSSFIVLPLEYQVLTDSVYVFASQQTTVTYQFGAKSQTANLRAGQWKEIPMGRSPPLVISSSQPIQVLYYCNGGKFSDGSVFDPFIMNIVPTSQFGEAYTLEGLDGFSNYALIVAKTKDVKEVQFDGKSPAFKWEQVHGTDYSWAHYTYEKGRGHHTLMSPCAPIGVYSVGTVDQNSYGAPAASGLLPCIHKGNYHPLGSSFWEDSACTKLCQCDPSTGIVSCQASQCKAGEECKVVGDVRKCVGKGIKEPEGKPKVRTCTYKGQQHLPGKPFWDDSACTKLCDCNPSTGVVSCHDSACKSGEECKLVDNVRTCVAKAPVHKTKYLYRYITVFMFNSVEKNPSKNQLYITSYLPDTKVLVTVNKSPFKKELSMEGRKSVTVEVPSDTELRGSGKYSKTVTVLSSKFITILSSNQKKNSVDTSLVYPVREWGKVYYVFTPSAAGYPKEMAIFSTHDGTTVTVELKCAVTFEGKSYKPGQKLSATVCSSEVIYLQSDQDCTGSRVVSDKPVGVMSGHACAWKNSKCQHVFEQLLPVEHWGSSFIVLPLEYQVLTDSVYVFASQQTTVTYQFGAKSQTANLRAGQWKEIPMSRSPPLVISSSQPIQVLYYCNGGKFSDGSVFDPFIMNIVPTSQFGEAYTLEGLDGFSNYALIVAKTKDVKEVQFDGKSPAFKWEQVHGTDYSWAHYTYEKGRGHHTLMSPCAPIGVYSVGTVDQNSYGAPAASGLLPCIHKGNYHPLGSSFWEDSACTKLCQCDPSTGIVSCQASQCKAGEECKVVGDVRQCVGKGIKEPEGKPKVRTCTYKGQQHLPGKPFWDDSACTKLCDCNPSTGVVSCHDSACKSGEECKLVDNVRTCVAKAPVHKTKYLYRYITVFMFNSVEKNPSKNQLYITSYLPDTKVLVTVNKSPFKKELSMEGRKSVTVEVPSDTELRGSGKYSKTVTVLSSKFITILSSNQKKNSVDTSLVYPVREWGKVYYVFTPSAAGYPKEMAIFSTHDGTTVTVELKCAVTFEGKSYKPGQKLSATVCSSEVIYLQSDQDCTGSRVVSDKPVGVMSGHACAWKNSKCQHVFEQLLPVEHWGSSFIVLPLEYQVLTDSVYVFASQQTTVTYQFGAKSQTANLRAGQWKEIPMGRSPPLVISSSQPIQVLYYCNGGKFSDGSVFDPFIMNIVPTSQFGEAYTLEGLDGFSNYALIVAKTKDVKEVQFDGKSPAFKWEQVHGTDYSWAHYTYEKGRGHHTLMSPCAPIGVYSVGTVDQNSYGAPAASGLLPCIHKGNYHPLGSSFWEDSACTKLCQCDPSTGIVSCQASQCKAGEECKVVGDVRKCVGKGIKEPEGKPKVRTCTYKGQQHLPGKPFWDDSACTKLCDCNPSTGVVSCHDSACKSGEECKLVDNVRTCVAKAPVHKTKYLYRYITVFMFNSVEKNPSKNQLYITSYLPDTKVLVTVNKSPFKKELSMEGRKSVTVEVPSDTELRGSGKYSKTVTVLSSKFITILSSNQKKNSVDTSLVYPVREWGKVYYVFTPSAAGYPKEMAIFSTHDGTTVTVELKCAVTFEGKSYKPGQKLSATVCSSEVIYLQSDQDCTGSRVVSDKPVGVMSGHACAWKNSKCQHVFEQLLPVEHWGSSFIVLPLEYQVLTDSVYVFASQQTTVTYQFGAKSQTANLRAGQWKEIPMGRSPPLVISSSQPIQVLYYCNGGKFSDGSVFDPFIMNIVPTSQFGEAYTLEGLDGFSNYALIVAKTKDVKEVQFDGKSPAFKWEQVHGTDYSWAHYTYEKGRGHHTLMSPCAPIGVYSVGTVDQNSYGAPAASGLLPCIHKGNYHPLGSSFWEDSACTKLCQCDPSTGIVSCQASQCKAGEECKVVGDVRKCVGKGIKEPEGKPAKYPFTYATAFMFNSNEREKSKNMLYITSYEPNTNVLVTVNKPPFKKELVMQGPKSVTVELPPETEMQDPGKYSKMAIIHSSKLITIVSSNQKKNSVDTSLVYPDTDWGKEYYIFTPTSEGYPKEMAIFTMQDATSVTVELRCGVTFEGKTYNPHTKLSVNLKASEVLYLQSNQDCTGSRVVSDKPVGVMSGHACAWKNSRCQHVFEQLLPVERWGTSFIVPPLEYQVLKDTVFVFASRPTRVTYQLGTSSQIIALKGGEWKEIPIGRSPPLVISSSQPIQVLYYCNGGKFSDGSVFDPFIMNIVPTDKFCQAHTLEGMEGFSNYALIVAKNKDIKEVQFDDKSPAFKWTKVHGTDYSWAHYTYEKGRGHHVLMHPTAPIGVYSVGTVNQNSYGAPAACGRLTCTYNGHYHLPGKSFWEDAACTKLCQCNPSTGLVSCQESRCKAQEECKIVNDVRTCVAKAVTKSKYPFTYVTVFMFNSNKKEKSKNEVHITSYESDTNVLVTVNKPPFKKELVMQGPKSVTVELPPETEMQDPGKYSKMVIIHSSKLITIVSSSQKKNSVDISLVYPDTDWGKEYYIFTPTSAGYPKEMAIFTMQDATSVTVELRCGVTFEGKTYNPHTKLSVNLKASEVLYLQSDQDCTGSRVVSDKPVGVMSGHACAWKNSRCQHVFEQLLPVERWGTSFIVPPLEYQVLKDTVFVFASRPTRVTYQLGTSSQIIALKGGEWKEIPIGRIPPLVISSSQPIQVLYYCNGGKFSDGSVFDPFIMNIVPTDKFCQAHTLEGMEGFSNYALIVAKNKDIKEVQFDDKHPSFKWTKVHGTDYSWAHYTYEKGRGHHVLMHPTAPIGVYSVGTVNQNSYGAPAACGRLTCTYNGHYHLPGKSFWEDAACTKLCQCNPSTGLVSCQDSRCKAEEECKLINDVRSCVAKVRTCSYKGQQHALGSSFWEDSACTKLCHCNPATGIVSCQASQCKAGEECKAIGGVGKCVAKIIPLPVIPPKVHTCSYKGQQHALGTSFWEDSACTKLCHCNPLTGIVSCQASQCKAGEKCEAVGGVGKCVAKIIPVPVIPPKAEKCPPNSIYKKCTHVCQHSCASAKPAVCPSACEEGCECNLGFMFDGKKCVTPSNCGCVHHGRPMKSGEAQMSADCSERCTCLPGGTVRCEKATCAPGESCVEHGGAWLCSKADGTCHLLPAGGLKTFDGLEDRVWMEGTYILAMPGPKTKVPFRVIGHLNLFTCEPAVTFSSLSYKDTHVEVKKDLTTLVNGKMVSLPFRIQNDLEIVSSKRSVVVHHTSGIVLRYCSSGKVSLTVTAAYSGQLAGLCGNFNGHADDDLRQRDDSVADSFRSFYRNWRV